MHITTLGIDWAKNVVGVTEVQTVMGISMTQMAFAATWILTRDFPGFSATVGAVL